MSNTQAVQTLTHLTGGSRYLFAKEREAIAHAVNTLQEIEASERQYDEWCNQQEAMQVARELCSTPELLEAAPW
ncbi:MAG: hypothetical protein ABSH44_17165 [Bryobacteraceae bacterium]|jgi:hypothetical protein